MLNCDEEGTDRFVPLKFELRTKTEKTDIFVQTFGPREKESINFIYENHNGQQAQLMNKFSKGLNNLIKTKII